MQEYCANKKKHLYAKDLHTDPILVRKIRRIQQSRRAQEDDEDEDMIDDSRLPYKSSAVQLEDSSGDEI